MKSSEMQYKIDHRGYQNIGELCDDLRDLTPNIRVEDERIVLFAPLDTLVIKLSNRGGYYVYRNGVQQNDVWDDQDLYPYVLEIQQNAPALEWLEVKYDGLIMVVNVTEKTITLLKNKGCFYE